ncbi:hypothetical protein L207DRAFT_522541 [Hyaloscypha variabilis F]|uniref:Uncharacterized protein n=1 Tax=Hyaloscypha variabilis (strain UAMH 11265 / GT02V1 / F) TaxID=1149755 RepID=A0A2J6S8J5_HYAVF|nr:hypothetical protein L207DRAFT_522541 [Hyaloscypha variabilis F]
MSDPPQEPPFHSTDDVDFSKKELEFLIDLLGDKDVPFTQIRKHYFPERSAEEMERRWYGDQIFFSTDDDEFTPEGDFMINKLSLRGKTFLEIQKVYFPARKTIGSVCRRWYDLNRLPEDASDQDKKEFLVTIDLSSFPICYCCFNQGHSK